MIILDTHIWVWWVHGDERLTSAQAEIIEANEKDVIGVSAITYDPCSPLLLSQ